ncbi:toll-like receptor 4 [Haliotis asinina]|uniref:toll-like receptor 4 n=1 Tax=Haliotis asinina TaxID=109174 RepID=UPI003531B349
MTQADLSHHPHWSHKQTYLTTPTGVTSRPISPPLLASQADLSHNPLWSHKQTYLTTPTGVTSRPISPPLLESQVHLSHHPYWRHKQTYLTTPTGVTSRPISPPLLESQVGLSHHPYWSHKYTYLTIPTGVTSRPISPPPLESQADISHHPHWSHKYTYLTIPTGVTSRPISPPSLESQADLSHHPHWSHKQTYLTTPTGVTSTPISPPPLESQADLSHHPHWSHKQTYLTTPTGVTSRPISPPPLESQADLSHHPHWSHKQTYLTTPTGVTSRPISPPPLELQAEHLTTPTGVTSRAISPHPLESQVGLFIFAILIIGESTHHKETEAGLQKISCSPCYCNTATDGDIHADCSNKHLDKIPSSLPSNVTHLTMTNNLLTKLSRDLHRFSHLKDLDLSKNNIISLNDSFKGVVTLLSLNLHGNQLTLEKATYPKGVFKDLKKLKSLDISNNTVVTNSSYPDDSLGDLVSLQKLVVDGLENCAFGQGFARLRNLRTLNISGQRGYCSINRLLNTSFVHTPYLEKLNISKCQITDIDVGSFLPLRNIDTLDMSENNRLGFKTFGDSMYGLVNSSLRVLMLNQIMSIYDIGVQIQWTHFRFLTEIHVEEIYLDCNKIETIEDTVLHTLRSVEVISLKNNYLSYNRFETVPKSLRYQIDTIMAERKDTFKIRMKGNNLKCTCDTLDDLEWMLEQYVVVEEASDTSCSLSDGTETSLDNLNNLVLDLQTRCKTIIPVIFGTTTGLILFLSVIVGGMIYRYRWKLRYLYYTTRRKYRGYQRRMDEEEHFIFDAFVSYAEEDREFVVQDMQNILEKRFGLRLCIHQRDFMVGEPITANVVNAIQSSRKTIILLTPSFLESSWCEYEVHMAKFESIHSGRDIFCVVWLTDVPDTRTISRDVLDEIENGTYIKYPGDEVDREEFWQKIKAAISF